MARHSGCYLCGSTADEYLTSVPIMVKQAASIALCSACYRLPNDEIKARIDKLTRALAAAREAANGQ